MTIRQVVERSIAEELDPVVRRLLGIPLRHQEVKDGDSSD